jgi:hypothetical protein
VSECVLSFATLLCYALCSCAFHMCYCTFLWWCTVYCV